MCWECSFNMDYFRTCVIKIITFHSRRPFQTTGQIVTHKNMPATTTSTISEQIHDAFPTLNTAQQFAHARAMARKQLVALKNEVGACLMLECGVRTIYLSIFFLLFFPLFPAIRLYHYLGFSFRPSHAYAIFSTLGASFFPPHPLVTSFQSKVLLMEQRR